MRLNGSNMATLVERYGWYEWLAHTNFSFLIGASHPHEFVDQACEFSYKGLGIADFDGVYGIARAYRDRKRRTEHRHPERSRGVACIVQT